jgi:hypothetical protein
VLADFGTTFYKSENAAAAAAAGVEEGERVRELKSDSVGGSCEKVKESL